MGVEGVVVTEKAGDAFVAAEPGCRASCFADQGAELAVPEAEDAVVAEDGEDYGERAGAEVRVWGEGDLHLALYELDWGEEEGGEGATCGSCCYKGG